MKHSLSPEAMFMVVTTVGFLGAYVLTVVSAWRPNPRHRATRKQPTPTTVPEWARPCLGCGDTEAEADQCPHGDVVCVDCDQRDVCGDCYMDGRAADGADRWARGVRR